MASISAGDLRERVAVLTLARTESGETILLGEVLVGLVDARVNVGGLDGDRQLDLIVLQGFNLGFQRMSSI